MSSPIIIIKHGVSVTKDFLLGQDPGFPNEGLLNPLVIHRAIWALIAGGTFRFEDGMFHGEIHPFGMDDLLIGISAAAIAEEEQIREENLAAEQNFNRPENFDAKGNLVSKKVDLAKIKKGEKKFLNHLGVRWEVAASHKTCRIYGPKSDPANIITIDLMETK